MNYYYNIILFIIIKVSLSIYVILNKSSFRSVNYKKLSNDLIYSYSYNNLYFLNKSLSIINSYKNIFIDNYSGSEYFSPELNYFFIVCTNKLLMANFFYTINRSSIFHNLFNNIFSKY